MTVRACVCTTKFDVEKKLEDFTLPECLDLMFEWSDECIEAIETWIFVGVPGCDCDPNLGRVRHCGSRGPVLVPAPVPVLG